MNEWLNSGEYLQRFSWTLYSASVALLVLSVANFFKVGLDIGHVFTPATGSFVLFHIASYVGERAEN